MSIISYKLIIIECASPSLTLCVDGLVYPLPGCRNGLYKPQPSHSSTITIDVHDYCVCIERISREKKAEREKAAADDLVPTNRVGCLLPSRSPLYVDRLQPVTMMMRGCPLFLNLLADWIISPPPTSDEPHGCYPLSLEFRWKSQN